MSVDSPKTLRTPLHESTSNSFSIDNVRLSAVRKRTIDVVLPTRKKPDFKRLDTIREPPFLQKSILMIDQSQNHHNHHNLHQNHQSHNRPRPLVPPPSPPKPARLRRATSLLTPAEASAQPHLDRFIPSHKNSVSGKLTPAKQNPHPNASPHSHISAQASKIYQHHVAQACGLDVNSRILSYKPPPPERTKPLTLFSSVASTTSTASTSASTRSLHPAAASARAKKIPAAPDRVLDAPNIVDDFYLNLVAWSLTNLIAIGLENTIYVWNALTGLVGLLCELDNNTLVTSLRWSDDGSYISVGKDDGSIEIWDIETNARLRTLVCGSSAARVAAHCWLAHLLASGSKEGAIYHSDVRVNDHLVSKAVSAHLAEICSIEYRPDAQQFCSGGNDNLVAIWDARNTADPLFTKTNHRAAVKAMAWCPFQTSLLATGGGTSDKTIHFWNTASGARVNLIETESQISSLNWGYANGTGFEVVATHGYPLNCISLFNYPTLQKTGVIANAHDSRILNGCLSPDGTTLATVAGDENLKFWSLFDLYKQTDRDSLGLKKHMKRLMELR